MHIDSNTSMNRNLGAGSKDDEAVVPLSDRLNNDEEPIDVIAEMIRIHMYEELTQLIFNGDEEESGVPQLELSL